MDSIEDGGAAFPHTEIFLDNYGNHRGLSMRDYFTAKAMQQLIYFSSTAKYDKDIRKSIYKNIALGSYEMADAMLEVRGKK